MDYLYLLPGVLLAITIHEFAHGWVSWKLGDPTPKREGRLTLNPLKHLDPMGAICMMLFHMGWARPVMVNPYYYKDPKKGTALVSLAGPAINLITGTIAVFILVWIEAAVRYDGLQLNQVIYTLYLMLYYFSVLSINLAVFNLIPLPPLDGSKILGLVLPDKAMYFINKNHNYFMIILMIALYMGFLDTPLRTLYTLLEDQIWNLAEFFFRNKAIGVL